MTQEQLQRYERTVEFEIKGDPLWSMFQDRGMFSEGSGVFPEYGKDDTGDFVLLCLRHNGKYIMSQRVGLEGDEKQVLGDIYVAFGRLKLNFIGYGLQALSEKYPAA
jgi:hypothetical protein